MKLTPIDVATAPLADDGRIIKLNDGNGLVLQIDARSKVWRFRFKRAGRDAMMSLGVYPSVTLAQARQKAADAKAMLARGEDPQAVRQRERDQRWLETTKTFGVAAAEYNATQAHRAGKTVQRCERMFRHSAKLHNRAFAELDRPTLLQCCRAIEQAGKHETAHRLGIYLAAVFRYARDEGYFAGADPTLGGFGKSLKPAQEMHHAALVSPAGVGGLMRNVDSWEWLDTGRGPVGATVGRALQILARTAVRAGELRQAEWKEFDMEGRHPRHAGQPTWVIPLHRMKMREDNRRCDHVVPLSRQVVAVLEAQRALTGHGKYVFPNARTDARPMTDAALSVALVALGYKDKHVPHGFRTTFKTLAQDVLKAESELVERQLAHKWGNAIEATYDAVQRLEERRELMQAYSDLLDKLRG
jgi:integrase